MSHFIFPNEINVYRDKRNILLENEIALRARIKAVAEQLRSLPPGGRGTYAVPRPTNTPQKTSIAMTEAE